MRRVALYASAVQYFNHLAPVWSALPEHVKAGAWAPMVTPWASEMPRRWEADWVVLVASYVDAAKVKPHPVIYVEHGAGQNYEADPKSAGHPSYSGGDHLENVALFLAPHETVTARWRARYPDTPAVVVGCPALDGPLRSRQQEAGPGGPVGLISQRAGFDSPSCHEGVPAVGAVLRSATGRAERGEGYPRIALALHWDCRLVPETMSAWEHYVGAFPALVQEAKRRGWHLLGHGHPRAWRAHSRTWRNLGIEPVENLGEVLDRADVLVFDNSSAGFEAMAVGIPTVVLDAPWYRREVEHGLRFWRHADAGVRIGDPADLPDAIALALADPPEQQEKRHTAVSAVYAHLDGTATQRAVTAIMDLL